MTDQREDREALIEEAAKAMYFEDCGVAALEDDAEPFREMARVALGVFELAHTPTENSGPIPLYGMLDVWMALYGTSHPEFDEFYAEHGYAETWARILAAVRERRPMQGEPTAAQEAEIAAKALDRLATEFGKTEGLGLTSDALWWWAWFAEMLGDKAGILRAEAAALRAAIQGGEGQ